MEHIQIYMDKAGEYRWRREAGNGQIVSTSGEGYVDFDHALDMARKLNPAIPVFYQGKDADER